MFPDLKLVFKKLRQAGKMFLIFGIMAGLMFAIVCAVALYKGPAEAISNRTTIEATAKLSELGWTVKPNTKSTMFEIWNNPLPSMKESAVYFRQLGKPFNLHFQQVPNLDGLHYLEDLSNCTKIEINAGEFTDLSELKGFTKLPELVISQLPLNGNDTVNISPLATLISLRQLNLNLVRTKSIEPLSPLKNLTILNLGQTLISDISPIASLTELENLDVRGTRVTDLTPLAQSKKLQELMLGGPQLLSLASLKNLLELKKISVIEQQPIDLSSVGELTNIETLWIWGGRYPIDVAPLQKLSKLKSLTISGLGFGIPAPVANISAIGGLEGLSALTLGQLQITDLSFAIKLRNLTELNLNQEPVQSIDEMRNMPLLRKVVLVDVPVVDISPLLDLPALNELTIGRTPARSDVMLELQRRGVKVTSF